MTLEEMKTSDKVFLTAEDVAPVLGCNPHSVRIQAACNPLALGFPVTVIGNRVKIPRMAFLRYITGEQ